LGNRVPPAVLYKPHPLAPSPQAERGKSYGVGGSVILNVVKDLTVTIETLHFVQSDMLSGETLHFLQSDMYRVQLLSFQP